MRFYLGVHKACWLERTDVPLFVSRRTLAPRKTLPRARGPWALDSGGFTELLLHGRWTSDHHAYAVELDRLREIGGLEWAAPQDWMCEPHMVERTGLSVEEHQRRTVQNFLDLRPLAEAVGVRVIPVLQGYASEDYWRCLDMYDGVGVDLRDEPLVGIGSVCRRQGTGQALEIIEGLAKEGLRLHAFGFKSAGLKHGPPLESSDSMAWSFRARRSNPLVGCTHSSCANCLSFALRWREQLLKRIGQQVQRTLF